jgi:hypothetical protein
MNATRSQSNLKATYRNPWHKSNGTQGPQFYETEAKPLEYAGCLIYERIRGACWDVVRDGVCLHQRAGLNGAKAAAEMAREHDYPTEAA